MINRDFYLRAVLPTLGIPLEKYPHVRLAPKEGYHPLHKHPVFMLVALTGTGKSTTLDELTKIAGDIVNDAIGVIPTRREIADWIAIPTAQVLLDEPIQAVSDRVQRFHYTRTFAEHVKGGMAAAFSWVQVADIHTGIIVSEGIRGANELTYALNECPGWHIVELALHPIIRLKRLSSRDEAFDKAEGAGDVGFLPDGMHSEAQQLMDSGEITDKALTIMRAESESYGLFPFAKDQEYSKYNCIDTDSLSPKQVAHKVYTIMKDTVHADD